MLRRQDGFTLIEMLVVVIILGILAMIIVPQISVSTDDARLRTLETNLGSMRSVIEVYRAQHADRYPGEYSETDGTTLTSTDALASTAFVTQLTQYTDINGQTSDIESATYKYGPYLKSTSLPTNPFSDTNTVVADFDQNSITAIRTVSGTNEAWMVYVPIGVIFANDNAAHAQL